MWQTGGIKEVRRLRVSDGIKTRWKRRLQTSEDVAITCQTSIFKFYCLREVKGHEIRHSQKSRLDLQALFSIFSTWGGCSCSQTVYEWWTEQAATLIGQKSMSLGSADLSAVNFVLIGFFGLGADWIKGSRLRLPTSQRKQLCPSSRYSLCSWISV